MFFLNRANRAAAAGPDPAMTPVRRRPSLDFSLTGLIYCAMMMFMGLAAINTQANLLFGVFGLMIGILLVSGIISRLVLRGVRVTRDLPEHGVVGKPMGITYQFLNGKKFWPSLSTCLAELDGVEGFSRQPQAYMLHAAAQNTAAVPVEVIPKRRGLVYLDRYQISTSFPFGFIKRAVERRQTDTMIVFPAVARVDPKLLATCMPAEKTGPTMRPKRGGVDEFYGLKEHRRGENPRFIYWRRSARTGVLVAKEMTQVAPPRLLIVVDTYIEHRTREEHAVVEKSIAMAASLASAGLEQGLSVGLHVWADDGWNGIPPTRGKRQRRDVMAMLARLPVNTSQDAQALLESAQMMVESGTTIVMLTGRNLELGLSEKLRGGVVIVSVNSPKADGWFTFEPAVEFSYCLPTDQEAELAERQQQETVGIQV
jgi:uncharacterized protein (DUF58 family)